MLAAKTRRDFPKIFELLMLIRCLWGESRETGCKNSLIQSHNLRIMRQMRLLFTRETIFIVPHNPEVVGSSPTAATNEILETAMVSRISFIFWNTARNPRTVHVPELKFLWVFAFAIYICAINACLRSSKVCPYISNVVDGFAWPSISETVMMSVVFCNAYIS